MYFIVWFLGISTLFAIAVQVYMWKSRVKAIDNLPKHIAAFNLALEKKDFEAVVGFGIKLMDNAWLKRDTFHHVKSNVLKLQKYSDELDYLKKRIAELDYMY